MHQFTPARGLFIIALFVAFVGVFFWFL